MLLGESDKRCLAGLQGTGDLLHRGETGMTVEARVTVWSSGLKR